MKHILQKLVLSLALATASTLAAAELEITGNDTMRFNVTELETTVGEETTVTFKNVGTLPKAAMGHNFVVLKPGTDLASFGNAAIAAAGNDYIPTEETFAQQVIAHTKVLGPGESDSVSFTIAEPGEYPFICSFPGHWAIMKGVLQVK
ncbi:plastocyanin/azurin family copper-binding protein [Pelagicoccus sp. SDUM812002]|uniref:plastocyanin/azurin family copper-binding protein n=1 Tax=Pelagicoccus sp. SDUM812002 TaxID=3041266 RepID=UPI00280F1203|nr:plastocyanin/azurin family copper-binding protein [Pelagicoccus sp. SDUM812002]MDQ8187001.1 plastocyanin/azurin family copper-binding protein [Pelagicoccus sp. SDUM812002]